MSAVHGGPDLRRMQRISLASAVFWHRRRNSAARVQLPKSALDRWVSLVPSHRHISRFGLHRTRVKRSEPIGSIYLSTGYE